jgi:hypothetical protein
VTRHDGFGPPMEPYYHSTTMIVSVKFFMGIFDLTAPYSLRL